MPADSDTRSAQRDGSGSDPMADHKRRARRRLIGAIIVAAVVASLAPMLLEEEARPLSQDLLIEIPSRNSIFTKIESLKPPAQESVSSSGDVKPETKPDTKSEPKPEPKPDTKAEPKSDVRSETRGDPKPEAKPEPRAEPKPEVKTEPKAEPRAEPKADVPPANARKVSGYLVQVGAYARAESANSVKAKLIMGGHRVVVEVIRADDGTDRHRVRIGPFATRDEALQVRDRAKAQGYEALLVTP